MLTFSGCMDNITIYRVSQKHVTFLNSNKSTKVQALIYFHVLIHKSVWEIFKATFSALLQKSIQSITKWLEVKILP